MNGLERDTGALLACYAVEERPPPAVDANIRARLRAEACRPRRRLRVLAVAAITAAAMLLWWASGPAFVSRTAVRDNSAAQNSVELTDRHRAFVHGATPSSLPDPNAIDDDDPGVAVLRAARDLVRTAAYEQALSRLEPCSRKVGADDLLEECEFLVLQALCGAGDTQEGRRRIAAFRDRWPGSIRRQELIELCK